MRRMSVAYCSGVLYMPRRTFQSAPVALHMRLRAFNNARRGALLWCLLCVLQRDVLFMRQLHVLDVRVGRHRPAEKNECLQVSYEIKSALSRA